MNDVVIEKSLFTGSVCLDNYTDGNVTICQVCGVVKLSRRQAIELKECLTVIIDKSEVNSNE